jgi:hypothetical protein
MIDERLKLDGGYQLHVHRDTAWEVWLNVDLDFDGLCIGCGASRARAVAGAIATLKELTAKLHEQTTEDARA